MSAVFDLSISKEMLINRNLIFGNKGICPDKQNCILQLRHFLRSIAEEKHPLYKIGKKKSIITIGLDSLTYDFVKAHMNPSDLYALTSIFPSTSSCAWVAAITGKTPEESGISGPVYYAPEIDAMYICLHDKIQENDQWIADHDRARKIQIGPWDSIFTDLKKLDYQTVSIDGFFSHKLSRWSQAIHHDADYIIKSKGDWLNILFDPHVMLDCVKNDIESYLYIMKKEKPNFMWTLVNLDRYVHHKGFTNDLADALRKFDEFLRQLSDQGHLVIICADHGQTEHVSVVQEGKDWNKLHNETSCRLPFGGAGRTRWSYPRPGQEEKLVAAIQDLVGDNGIVFHRDDLDKLGMCHIGPALKKRVGEIITVATGARFPVADYLNTTIFEHGSITADEMVVPLAVYKP